MPKVSEIREETIRRGYEWTTDRYQYAIDKGAEKDEDFAQAKKAKAIDVNTGFVGNQFNPIMANAVAGLVRGIPGLPKPPMVGPTGSRGLDLATAISGQVGELGGMAATSAVLPTPAALSRLPGVLARMVPAAFKGLQYGAASGLSEGIYEGEDLPEIAKRTGARSLQDMLMFGGLAWIPKFPAKLGGAYGQSAAIGAGLGGATGGLEGALAGGLAFPLSHAVVGPALEGRPMRRPGAKEGRSAPQAEGEPVVATEVEAPATGKQGVEEAPPGVVRPPRKLDAARSVASRLERMSPESAKVGALLREAVDKGQYQELGKRSAPVVRTYAEVGKPNDKEATRIGQALDGKRPVKDLTPKEAAIFKAHQDYYMGVPERAQAADMKVRVRQPGQPVKKVPWPNARPDYFPHVAPEPAQVKKGPLRNDIVRSATEEGYFADEATAGRMLDSWVSIVERGGRSKDKAFAKYLVAKAKAEGRELTTPQAVGMIVRAFKNPRIRRFGSAEYAREFDNPFYDRNARRAFASYSKGIERRIAESAVMGQDLKILDKAIGKIKNPQERQVVGGLVRVALETTTPGDPMFDAALRSARGIASLKLSYQTSLRNLTGANNIMTRTDFDSFMRGLAKTATSEGKMFGHESGATAGPTLSSTEGVGGWGAKYYKAIGFSGTETKLRQHAANSGAIYMQKMAKRYARAQESGREDKWALRELKAIGLDPQEVIANKGQLTKDQLLRSGFKVAIGTQHSYHPLDLPAAFTSTELGRALFMFKPYAVQQSKMLMNSTVDLLRKDAGGNRYPAQGLRNIAILLAMYPASGEVVNDIIAIAKGKKRESDPLKRYLENLVYAGGVGVLADLYGAIDWPGSAMGAAAGPLIGMPAEAAELGAKVAKNGFTDSTARALVRRIPGVGPLLAPRLFPWAEKQDKEDASARPTRRAVPNR